MLPSKNVILLFMSFVYGVCINITHSAKDSRIVGGHECDYKDYTFAVAIFGVSLCTGSIISLQWVLTAAHCINDISIRNNKTWLRTGFSYEKVKVQTRRAKKGIRHENFTYNLDLSQGYELRFDIGLIQVAKDFERNQFLSPAVLPTPGFTDKCSIGTAAGIGEKQMRAPALVMHQRELNFSLHCVDLPIVSKEVCALTWGNSILDDSIICTMEEGGGKDACFGDSGGPLVCKGVVIGIISAGKGCALPMNSATHTAVELYLDFIKEFVPKSLGRVATCNLLCLVLAVFAFTLR